MVERTYEKLYFMLFDEITSAVNEIEQSMVVSIQVLNALQILKQAQRKAEDMFLDL